MIDNTILHYRILNTLGGGVLARTDSAKYNGADPYTYRQSRSATGKEDVSLAKRIGIPIYTVSVSGICIAKPDGVVKQLSGVGWYKSVRKQ